MKLRNLWLLAFILVLSRTSLAAGEIYTFGIVPQQAASEMADSWVPFLKLLSERSGVQLRFATAPDIPTFEKRLSDGAYDIAYMNPYHYTVYHKISGYEAFAKEKDRKLNGILVVSKDSPIKEIKDLSGSTIIFPAPAAFAASILPRAALRKAGITFTTKFVSSHDSVYLNVVRGMYPAGGGISRTFEMLDDKTKTELRVLWTTKSYTSHAIAHHPNIPKAAVLKLQSAMAEMAGDTEGREKLKLIGFKGIEAARDSDWNDVRQLNISELDTRAE